MSVSFLYYRSYFCTECGFELRLNTVETEFGSRMTLLHDRHEGCAYSLKRFHIETVALDEFTDEIKPSTKRTQP